MVGLRRFRCGFHLALCTNRSRSAMTRRHTTRPACAANQSKYCRRDRDSSVLTLLLPAQKSIPWAPAVTPAYLGSPGPAYVTDTSSGKSILVSVAENEIVTDGTLSGSGDTTFLVTTKGRMVKVTVTAGGGFDRADRRAVTLPQFCEYHTCRAVFYRAWGSGAGVQRIRGCPGLLERSYSPG